MKSKKILSISGILLIGFLVWYLFLKPYDYLVSFTAKTFPGTINQTIKTWNTSIKGASIKKSADILHLDQAIPYADSTFLYQWEIKPITDSTSAIKVYVTDLDHSLQNRLTYPFFHTDFEKRVKNSMLDFNEKLKEHISRFKVKIVGESEIEETFCAYISIESTQIGKAMGMMKNYSLLTSTLLANKTELNGKPFIVINEWNMANDSIKYDFCYPIKKNDSLTKHPLLSYKEIKSQKALKAIYNGNYISSDRAWYALLDYAKKHEIEVDERPFEIFHNNPNMGGDELEWTADIYMPVIQK
jgi:effector-binding domain-containing protein